MTSSTASRRSAKLPSWLRRKIPLLHECSRIEQTINECNLHTVCREALCPNRSECYSKGKVTFMILGDTCTRGCRFCSVAKGKPEEPDADEPENIARAASALGLAHVVVTSVTRDDLKDGGSGHFADVIEALRGIEPRPVIEVLVPDFGGQTDSLEKVLQAAPDIFSHNMETVRRLYGKIRVNADYDRSLFILSEAKRRYGEVMTKSSFILGLGENTEEVIEGLSDLRRAGCDFVAIGQYLRPGMEQVPVAEYIRPERFKLLEEKAYEMGFLEVASGPLVRSSYQENRLDAYRADILE